MIVKICLHRRGRGSGLVIITDDAIIAVTRSDLDVPFVVRLRIEKPEA